MYDKKQIDSNLIQRWCEKIEETQWTKVNENESYKISNKITVVEYSSYVRGVF